MERYRLINENLTFKKVKKLKRGNEKIRQK